jgi:hypothetical protein
MFSTDFRLIISLNPAEENSSLVQLQRIENLRSARKKIGQSLNWPPLKFFVV